MSHRPGSGRDKRLSPGRAFLALTVVLFLSATSQGAPPVQWTVGAGGNGHWYELVTSDPTTWDLAEQHAQAKNHLGAMGYLVTITSPGERAFVNNLAGVPGEPMWIGMYQVTGSQEPDGGWTWVTGEDWGYTDWLPGEPNNCRFGEDSGQMYLDSDPVWRGWNDCPSNWDNYYYMIEYTPEPATLALLALGGLAVMAQRKKK